MLIDGAYVLRSPGDTEEASSGMCVLDAEEVGQSTQARKEEAVLRGRGQGSLDAIEEKVFLNRPKLEHVASPNKWQFFKLN